MSAAAAPQPLLSVWDGILLILAMVLGAGIFKAPAVVAAHVPGEAEFLLAWVLGAAASLCGALVYAELASRWPDAGGEYSFLARGWGRGAAFVFAWSRLTVVQTGVIAAVAYVFGDYASELLRLGEASAAIYAALGVAALTALNVAGTLQSKRVQATLQIALLAGMLGIGVAGLGAGGAPAPAEAAPAAGSFGLAMIFVLLAYGGWNEAAYLGGELRDPRRGMLRVLVGGIAAVSLLYLVVNAAYLAVLGLGGLRESKAIAADFARALAGDAGAAAAALLVCVAALTSMNAAIFTGARAGYALGRDFAMFRALGRWRATGSAPATALWVQGAISLALVGLASAAPDGFTARVAYTATVFWSFFLLTSLTVFRGRRPEAAPAAFRLPLYPALPVLFCLVCVTMLYSSIGYARVAASFGAPVLGGMAVMAAGIPLYFLARGR
ncbi:MAG: APC family permease [Betaproteobacteria bacterium]